MTNQEWIEYYRFHPSEFDALITFCEGLATEVEAWERAAAARVGAGQHTAAAREQAYQKLEAENAELRELLQKYLDGYYTDGAVGLTLAFDVAARALLKSKK